MPFKYSENKQIPIRLLITSSGKKQLAKYVYTQNVLIGNYINILTNVCEMISLFWVNAENIKAAK